MENAEAAISSQGEVKSLRTGGVKNFKMARGEGVGWRFGGVTFAGGGVQYYNTCHAILIFESRLLSFIRPVQSKDYNIFDPTGLKFLILDFLVI